MSMPILVIDLEATCADDGSISSELMETIEIGACWVENHTVIGTFQSFVKPVRNQQLTPFCINLTGITQNNIEQAPDFVDATKLLREFVEKYRAPESFWGSWGAYDRKQIDRDCLLHGIESPINLPHQNLKKIFAKTQKIGKEIGMKKACELRNIEMTGNHHRALDDAINITYLLPWIYPNLEKIC
jgi:inhibitor of KinA sporulation pathway (predicted exonuclease)